MSDNNYKKYVVDVLKSGTLAVYVQGYLDDSMTKTVFVTVHDVGTNQKSWKAFVDRPCMADVRKESIFLHICVRGQEDGANTLPHDFAFPTLDDIAYDIAAVIEYFNLKTVIAVGEGAGANIVARLAMNHPGRILGIILVHCTSTTAGPLEHISDMFIQHRLASGEMTPAAWDYLIYHKFGRHVSHDSAAVHDYASELKNSLNPVNLSHYMNVFLETGFYWSPGTIGGRVQLEALRRTDLSTVLAERLNVPVLLVCGAKASHLHTVYTMEKAMKSKDATLVQVGDVGDCLTQAPEKVARALILFSKSLGALTDVAMPRAENQRCPFGSILESGRESFLLSAEHQSFEEQAS